MSFLKSLFGGGAAKPSTPAAPVTAKRLDHNGFVIEAQPYAEAGQYQVAGRISKEIGGEVKEHRFVRADRYSTIDDAAEVSINKGRQIIDQQGDRLFS